MGPGVSTGSHVDSLNVGGRAECSSAREAAAGQRPPFAARRLTESIAHRDQSSSPRAPSSSRTTRWSRAQTRCWLHWAKRRYTLCQQGPKTGGSCRQVQPDTATNTIAAKASHKKRRLKRHSARSPTRPRRFSPATDSTSGATLRAVVAGMGRLSTRFGNQRLITLTTAGPVSTLGALFAKPKPLPAQYPERATRTVRVPAGARSPTVIHPAPTIGTCVHRPPPKYPLRGTIRAVLRAPVLIALSRRDRDFPSSARERIRRARTSPSVSLPTPELLGAWG